MSDERELKALELAERSGALDASALSNLRLWLTDRAYAAERAEIVRLAEREAFDQLQDAFGTILPFGTGGRRGPMGPGPNRINARTIAESAHGLSRYVLAAGGARQTARRRRIAIAYDTRRNSRRFAEVAASVVAGHGIEALLFEEPRATPELSYAVRALGASAGIVISASHNPPSDNGFKAYWSDGGQVVPPHDRAIIEEVSRARELNPCDLETAAREGLFRLIGEEVDAAYERYTAGLALGSARDVRLVYTPLHGTGRSSVARALTAAGFGDLHPVRAQWEADEEFSGVPGHLPNPENPAALEAGIAEAKAIGADLVLASDPDADRLGAVVRHGDRWVFLTGNQIGVLLFEHVARTLAKAGSLPSSPLLLKTCVTSDLLDRIAEDFGIAVRGDFLVGFKYIGESIAQMPDASGFVFGIEESHGYLRGPEVRDKDAAQAAVLLAERAAELKPRSSTLIDALEEIWERYGYYVDLTRAIPLQGTGGETIANRMMDALREAPPRSIGGEKVFAAADRKTGRIADPASGRETGRTTGAAGNLLIFHLAEDGSERISIRPSGTEPKIKIYIQIRAEAGAGGSPDAREAADRRAERLAADFAELTRRA